MPYDISKEKRDWYREISARSRQRKKAAIRGEFQCDPSRINKPVLEPNKLMPQQRQQGLRAMSLFSGGGGLDLGFERAGFEHIASFDALDICGATLQRNRPQWMVYKNRERKPVCSPQKTDISGSLSKTVLFCRGFQKIGSLKVLCTKSLGRLAIPFVRR